MKAAIAWHTGDATWKTVRPPLVELDAHQGRQLFDALENLGFAMPDAASLRQPLEGHP